MEIAKYDNEHFRISSTAFFDEMDDKNNKNSFQDQCESCRCVNAQVSPRLDPYLPALRVDTTTTVLMTVAAVGALCSTVFAFYLTCKACGEVVEGSQVKGIRSAASAAAAAAIAVVVVAAALFAAVFAAVAVVDDVYVYVIVVPAAAAVVVVIAVAAFYIKLVNET